MDKTGDCWVWNGWRDSGGYGRITVHGRGTRAHRYSYELANGKIPEGLFVCHRCDNPPCVNPAHLFTGTVQDNTIDAMQKGRLATGDRNGARLHPERLRRGRIIGRSTANLPRGSRHVNSKLTEGDVASIRAMAREGRMQRDIARLFGVSRATVCLVVSGKIWRHVQ